MFAAPALLVYFVFLVYPALSSLWFSFTDWDGLSATYNVVGLKNYTSMPSDPVVVQAAINNLIWAVVTVVVPVVLGLALAVILNGKVRGKPVLRLIFYTPAVLPLVSVASIWGWLYNPQYGAINAFLRAVGLDSLAQPWLGQDSTALAATMVAAIWLRVGFPMLLYLAALQGISPDLYEAATVDGASSWNRFVHVTLPGLRHVITVTVTLSSIWTFNNFDLIWLLTQGGPGDVTAPYVLVAYSKAILQLQFGAGAAATLVMLPVIGGLVFFLVRLLRRDAGTKAPRRIRTARQIGTARRIGTARKVLPWVIAAAVAGLLAWASPQIFWKAAVVLGVILLVAAAVGRVVSALQARGGRRASSLVSGLGSGVALAGLLVFVLGPLYWIAVTAFKSEGQVVMRDHDLWPTPWTLEQFGALFTNQPFGRWYLNTVLVSTASTAVALVCAALGGYALARLRFRGAQGFTVTVLLTYVMPGALLFIPLYQLLIGMRLSDSLWSLVLTYPTFTLPFATWLLTGYFSSIPVELEEAALVDGCTRVQAFRRVVLPLAKPGLLAVALFTLTNAWNEFLFAFVFITKDEYKTLPVGMQSMIAGDVVPQGQLAAASLLVSIPVVVMYAFGQRFLTEGLTAGAVKG